MGLSEKATYVFEHAAGAMFGVWGDRHASHFEVMFEDICKMTALHYTVINDELHDNCTSGCR
ncbi:MAG: hypothetical protein ACI91B_001836 [Planctomycetota bacterium]|jgi:hypothetical protein